MWKFPLLQTAAGPRHGFLQRGGGRQQGNIWVVDRCAANSCVGSKLDPIMEFDAKGNFVKSFALACCNSPMASAST